MLNTIVSLFIAAISPDYAVAIDETDYTIYVCSVPEHCDTMTDECLDTYQSFDVENECFNCSTENNPFSNFCDSVIPFEYDEHKRTTFGMIDTNITVNMMQILHDTKQFSLDDYREIMITFSADCLEYQRYELCQNALFLTSHYDVATNLRSNKSEN